MALLMTLTETEEKKGKVKKNKSLYGISSYFVHKYSLKIFLVINKKTTYGVGNRPAWFQKM